MILFYKDSFNVPPLTVDFLKSISEEEGKGYRYLTENMGFKAFLPLSLPRMEYALKGEYMGMPYLFIIRTDFKTGEMAACFMAAAEFDNPTIEEN